MDRIDPKLVGRRLEAVREALEMNQLSFSGIIGVDPSSYTKIKKGQKPLSPDMAYRLFLGTNIPMHFIYMGNLQDLPEKYRQTILNNLGGQTR